MTGPRVALACLGVVLLGWLLLALVAGAVIAVAGFVGGWW